MSRILVGLIVPLLMIAACSDDKVTETGQRPGDELVPLATTADQMVENLQTCYETQDFTGFEQLVHPDFVFEFSARDISASPGGSGTWDRAAELAATQAMLGGVEGHGRDGTPIPAIKTISLRLTPLQPTWEDASGEGPEYVGLLKRRYATSMTARHSNSDLMSEVAGEQIFYARPALTGGAGSAIDVYHIERWRDLGLPTDRRFPAATERLRWGQLKAQF